MVGLVAACGLSLVAVSRGYSSLHFAAALCSGFCLAVERRQALGMWASVVVAFGLRSGDTWVWLLRGMWDLPKPEMEPVSLSLQGGILNHWTTKEALLTFLF